MSPFTAFDYARTLARTRIQEGLPPREAALEAADHFDLSEVERARLVQEVESWDKSLLDAPCT